MLNVINLYSFTEDKCYTKAICTRTSPSTALLQKFKTITIFITYMLCYKQHQFSQYLAIKQPLECILKRRDTTKP